MKKHRITLPEAQHRAALEGKASMVALCVTPKPQINAPGLIDPMAAVWRWRDDWYYTNRLREVLAKDCPYAVGDLLACRERHLRVPGGDPYYEINVPGRHWRGEVNAGGIEWQPASRMPLSAVRLWLRVTSIRACRVRVDVSESEARAMGHGKIMSLGDDGHRKCLMIRWCKQRGHSVDDWAWLMGVEKVEGPRK